MQWYTYIYIYISLSIHLQGSLRGTSMETQTRLKSTSNDIYIYDDGDDNYDDVKSLYAYEFLMIFHID